METRSILLLRDFREDQRISMEVYGDHLLAALRAQEVEGMQFADYRPQLAPLTKRLPDRANLRMRTARYLDYPRQVRGLRADLYHVLDHGYAHLMQVLPPVRTLVTVHDLIPILAGRGQIPGVKIRRNWLAEWTARFYARAAHLIAISENTKRDLVEHCGCLEERISVIYSGISERYHPQATLDLANLRRKLHLPVSGWLVLITGDAFYKNQATSLQVMEQLWQRYPRELFLVRLGRNTAEWQALYQGATRKEQIVSLAYLAPSAMPDLYRAVDCLLFPSWYEGFGWPPVEAMACGTPVVASHAASLPEAVGDGGILAPPEEVAALAQGVERLWTDRTFREQQIQRGFAQAARFRWEETARQVLDLYRKLLS